MASDSRMPLGDATNRKGAGAGEAAGALVVAKVKVKDEERTSYETLLYYYDWAAREVMLHERLEKAGVTDKGLRDLAIGYHKNPLWSRGKTKDAMGTTLDKWSRGQLTTEEATKKMQEQTKRMCINKNRASRAKPSTVEPAAEEQVEAVAASTTSATVITEAQEETTTANSTAPDTSAADTTAGLESITEEEAKETPSEIATILLRLDALEQQADEQTSYTRNLQDGSKKLMKLVVEQAGDTKRLKKQLVDSENKCKELIQQQRASSSSEQASHLSKIEALEQKYAKQELWMKQHMEVETYDISAKTGAGAGWSRLVHRVVPELEEPEPEPKPEHYVPSKVQDAVADAKKDVNVSENQGACHPTITDEQKARAQEIINGGDRGEIIQSKLMGIHAANVTISRRDLQCLQPGEWLNDEVINFWMELLSDLSQQLDDETVGCMPSVHIMSTLFYPRMCVIKGKTGRKDTFDYPGVRRWTKNIDDVFAYDMIFIPLHQEYHWTLAVVNMRDKKIQYFDSMDGRGRAKTCLGNVKRWMEEESLDKKNEAFDFSGWDVLCHEDCPQQRNYSDCGVFMCQFVKHMASHLEPTECGFDQGDMPMIRWQMVHEIITGKVERRVELEPHDDVDDDDYDDDDDDPDNIC